MTFGIKCPGCGKQDTVDLVQLNATVHRQICADPEKGWVAYATNPSMMKIDSKNWHYICRECGLKRDNPQEFVVQE